MTTREALLQAVYATPDDDLPRLVFADHLDESGEPERAELIRTQVEIERGVARYELLERAQVLQERQPDRLLGPVDAEAFELIPARPVFNRGFLSAVAFDDFGVWDTDPPMYPVEELADCWHHLCDLIGRNPLVGEITCPGWFDVRILPAPFGRSVMPWFEAAGRCPRCGGEGRRRGRRCGGCDGTGVTRTPTAFEVVGTDWATVDPVLRWRVGRLLFGDDHPHFQSQQR